METEVETTAEADVVDVADVADEVDEEDLQPEVQLEVHNQPASSA